MKVGVAMSKTLTAELKAGQKWHERLLGEMAPLEDYLLRTVASDDALTEAAAQSLIKAGGKRIRPGFAYLAGKIFGAELTDMLPLLAALELIHTGSLVHDDIIDRAKLRRGLPTTSFVHGEAAALYVGDFLIGRALEQMALCRNSRINLSINRTVLQMCRGEFRQERDFFNTNQGRHTYFVRIRCKTALLFAGSCECGAAFAGAAEEQVDALWRFGYRLGMSFQIIDDLLDLTADEKTLGKPAGNDLKQGNLTLPVLYALRGKAGDELKSVIWRIKDGDLAALPIALETVRKSGGVGEVATVARRFLDEAAGDLAMLPKSRERELLAAAMGDFAAKLGKFGR